jgi:hypothetical protein
MGWRAMRPPSGAKRLPSLPQHFETENWSG